MSEKKQKVKFSIVLLEGYRKVRYVIRLFTRYPLELVGALVFCGFFRLLPLDKASAFGGFLGRKIGPHLKISWVARYNLMKVFPEKDVKEIDTIVKEMWDNLIRVFVEYPHLRSICRHNEKYIDFVNLELCEKFRDDGKPGIAFSAHIGNWEMASVAAMKVGMPLHRVYRSSNNPYVEWLFRYFRQKIKGLLVPKGLLGFRQIVTSLRKGGHLALMIDQKMNEGIDVDFFGYSVKTTPSLATLYLKYGCPIISVHCERVNGARFRVITNEFTPPEKTGDNEKDILCMMQAVHACFEQWIRKYPEQWLWVHKRFPDSKLGAKQLYKERSSWKKGIKPEAVFQEAIKNRTQSA